MIGTFMINNVIHNVIHIFIKNVENDEKLIKKIENYNTSS